MISRWYARGGVKGVGGMINVVKVAVVRDVPAGGGFEAVAGGGAGVGSSRLMRSDAKSGRKGASGVCKFKLAGIA